MKTSVLSAAIVLSVLLAQAASADEKKDKDKLSEREAAFQKMLSGATLEGHYTLVGKKETGSPKAEKYVISKLEKLNDATWVFHVRIQYGDHDVTLPLPLPVEWAGKTPMIAMDRVPVPGLGTFDARVIFHNGKYAGTWSASDHGGHLYGRIIAPEEGGAGKEAVPE